MMFIVEIAFKWYNGFINFFKVGWNVFDLVIVFVALVGSGTWLPPVLADYDQLV